MLYVAIGRRYIHRRTASSREKTNIDTIIGKHGIVQMDIGRSREGMVKVGYEEWRARAEEDIKAGEEITVTGITGATLTVKKMEGSE